MITYPEQAATPMDAIQGRLFAVIGGADPEEVLALVTTQLSVSERELHEIPGRAQQRGPDFVQTVREPMEAALDKLRGYHAWLTDLHRSLEPYDHDGILRAYEDGQTVIPALTEALDAYGKQFSSHGSYATGWANSLARLAEGINAGQAAEETWDEYLGQFQTMFSNKRKEVEATQVPGKTLCAQGYADAAQTLSAMLALEALDESSLRPHLETLDRCVQTAERLEQLISQSTEGPAKMPATNILLNVVRHRQEKNLDAPTLKSFVKDYRTLMDNFWEGFERSLERPVDSALLKDEIPRTLEQGDAHDSALESLGTALDGNDEAGIEKALQQLTETAARLDESREVFATAAQHQSNVMCGGCGRANPPENRRCEACGNPLPQQTQASSTFNAVSGPALEETEEMQMTENVAALFTACDNVAVGAITPQQFAEEIKTAMTGLKEYAEELDEIATDMADESIMPEETAIVWREQHLPYMLELSAAFTEGLEQCQRGLEEMTVFLTDPDNAHLVSGVRQVWEGLGVIHRARLSMNSTLKMIADVLEEAAEKSVLSEEGEGA